MKPIKQIRLNGKIQQDERLVYSQTSHIPGRIEELLIEVTGEYVTQGQIIAYLYAPELETAFGELLEAKKIQDTQPQLFISAREKLKNWRLSEKQIDEVVSSEQVSKRFPITADFSGFVIQRYVNEGDYLKQGELLYQIADLSRVWVLWEVYERDIHWIKKGDKVEFELQALPGERFTRKISFVDPVIDPKTRVAHARVTVANSDYRLKPEMFVMTALTPLWI